MDIKAYRYFKKLFKEIAERKQEGLLKNSSTLTIERFNNKFLTCYKKFLKYKQNKYSSYITSSMRKKYLKFIKEDFKITNKGLKPYQITKLNPLFRKELNNRILFSLSLIKTQDKTSMQKLSDRFLNWLNNETMNGNDKSLAETLSITKNERHQDRHYNFILKDQTQKLFCAMDSILAKEYQAIGFYWKTRRDNRVVGNPIGLYPKPTNPDMHDNHYKRQGRFYFYKNTWVLENNLVDKQKIEYAEFDDGLPGEPIGCRCYAENIYSLEEIPQELLSDRGIEYLETL